MGKKISWMVAMAMFAITTSEAASHTDCCDTSWSCYRDEPCGYSSFYLGGTYNYTVTNFPQYSLVDAFDAASTNPDVFADGTGVRNQMDRQYSGWSAYAGYRYVLANGWDFGVELGYKDLGKFNTTFGPYLVSSVNVDTYRNTNSNAWDLLLTARYTFTNGFNIFGKVGPAYVRTHLREGNFVSASDGTSLEGVFGSYSYKLNNLYPEAVVGVGYQVNEWLNVVASYSHIFGPTSTSRFLQDQVSTDGVVLRPAQSPSFDIVSIGLEISFDAFCR